MAKRLSVVERRHGKRFIAMAAGIGSAGLFLHSLHAADPATVIKLTDELKFTPSKVTVKAGDTVQWKNVSVLVHTVTDDAKLAAKTADYALPKGAKPFNSGNIAPKGNYEHTFTVPGTYKYYCIPHEATGMVAEVAVTK